MTVPTTTRSRSRSAEAPRYDDAEVRLMLRVQNDEPGAFAELVRDYWPRVFGRFLRTLTDRQEAEDLAQEVFLRLYRARKSYQPRARFNTWLFHIAQNAVRNVLRSRRRRPLLRLGGLTEADEQSPRHTLTAPPCESPSGPLERSELATLVRAAVSDLGERQRTALELHQFHNRTYAEIAVQLDMSPKAAKSLLYRARNQLRTHLARRMDDSER